MGRPRNDTDGLCPRCNANLQTRPVFVIGQHRMTLESSCPMCGHLEYPEYRARKMVLVDLTDHPNILHAVTQGPDRPGDVVVGLLHRVLARRVG